MPRTSARVTTPSTPLKKRRKNESEELTSGPTHSCALESINAAVYREAVALGS